MKNLLLACQTLYVMEFGIPVIVIFFRQKSRGLVKLGAIRFIDSRANAYAERGASEFIDQDANEFTKQGINALQIDVPMSIRTYVLMSLQSKVQVPLKIMVWLFSQTFVLKR